MHLYLFPPLCFTVIVKINHCETDNTKQTETRWNTQAVAWEFQVCQSVEHKIKILRICIHIVFLIKVYHKTILCSLPIIYLYYYFIRLQGICL